MQSSRTKSSPFRVRKLCSYVWLSKKCVEYVLAGDASTNLPFSKKSDDMLPQVRRNKTVDIKSREAFRSVFPETGHEAVSRLTIEDGPPNTVSVHNNSETMIKKHRSNFSLLSYSQQITRWMSRLESFLFRLTSGDPTQQWPILTEPSKRSRFLNPLSGEKKNIIPLDHP